MHPQSAELNDRLIATLNGLPGRTLPKELGGGEVAEPKAVIHLGDMVDSGDKLGSTPERMVETEWKAYTERFGLAGNDGKLRYPVYEIHGNHDTPRRHNAVIDGIIVRNKKRPGLKNVSANGLHYSWDWNGIHFVALGNVVGANADGMPISRYEAFDSLPFLIADLNASVGSSGRPVVILHHVDLLRYSAPPERAEAGLSRAVCCEGMAKIAWCSRECKRRSAGISAAEWGAFDVQAYHRAIRGYNVAAVFHGHLHARRIDVWDGTARNAKPGIPVFGSKNSGAGGAERSLFYCRVEDGELVVRELRSTGRDGWNPEKSEIRWEPQAWRAPLIRKA